MPSRSEAARGAPALAVDPPIGLPRREAIVLAVCVGLFLVLGAVRARAHAYPYFDEVRYLELANEVREIGGPIALVRDLFSARWAEDNRHPLYLGVLSLVAGRDPGFHARAQILTLILGAMALLAWWRVTRRHAGPGPALIVAAFLSMSECLVSHSASEACEPLLLLFGALAIGAILDGIADPRRWIAAGAYAGLSYLDKQSGVFLVVCFAVALLLWRGWRALSDRWAWGMGLAFVAVASPLLVRNLRMYGSPLHNWNSQLFWIDRLWDFAEIRAPGALEALPHGFFAWAAQTSWHEIWFGRGVMGVAETAVHLGDAMSFVAPAPLGAVHIPGVVLGFALFVLAVRILYKAPLSFARVFLLTQTALFLVVFFLYSVVAGSSRYVFPMTLPLYAVLAVALARERLWLRRWCAVALACVLLALGLQRSPGRPPADYVEAGRWLEQHLAPGEGYAVDTRSHFQPAWLLPRTLAMHEVSSTRNGEPLQPGELLPWLRNQGVRYLVVDYTSERRGAPRYFFFDRLPRSVPAELNLVWSVPGSIQIFEMITGSAPAEAVLTP